MRDKYGNILYVGDDVVISQPNVFKKSPKFDRGLIKRISFVTDEQGNNRVDYCEVDFGDTVSEAYTDFIIKVNIP